LADVVASAVQSMVAPYGRVLTECSGGLDSSIVNACLAARGEGGRVATVLHYVGDRPDSDERAWAAQLCDRWALPLSLATREVGRFDPEADFAELARDIRPPLSALDGWRDRDVSAQVRRHGAEAVLTGMGGDAAFFQMPSAQVLSDLWQARGLGGLQDPAWREVPRWLRRSAWSTAHEAVGALRRPGRAAQHPFAGPRVREPTTAPAHPWLVGVEAAPPGKRLQIAALTALQLTLGRNRRSAAADMLHPLLSQPVMETCLSIPSWVLVRGGRDRGLAREAFAELLPPALVSRRSKGSLTSLYSRRAAASLDVLRPYLLDGVLADAGVLDRAAMEVALDPDHLIWRADGLQLISATAIEAWARHWQTRVADAPHAARRRS
jgi:asparagine synthase (glutamine-hydrolysing)